MADLEELVKQRKEEAREKQTFQKANYVADALGKQVDINRNSDPSHYQLKEGTLVITKDYTYGPQLTSLDIQIDYEGKLVFHENVSVGLIIRRDANDMTTYIPSDWELQLDELYKRAVTVTTEKNQKTEAGKLACKEQKEAEYRRKWGL